MKKFLPLFVLALFATNLCAMQSAVEDSQQADAAREQQYREKATFGSYEADIIRYIDQYPVNRVPLILLYDSFLESEEGADRIEMADFMMKRVLKKTIFEISREAAADFADSPEVNDQNAPQLELRNAAADNQGGGPIRYRNVALVAGGALAGAYMLKRYLDQQEKAALLSAEAQETTTPTLNQSLTKEEKERLFARRDEALKKLIASRHNADVIIPYEITSVLGLIAMHGTPEHKNHEFQQAHQIAIKGEAAPRDLVLRVINHVLLILPSYRDKFAAHFYATSVKQCEEFKAALENGHK